MRNLRTHSMTAKWSLLSLLVFLVGQVQALEGPKKIKKMPTKILVRAISRDAKVIGSSLGGARITIRDATTGKVLAQGITEGGTGNTQLIMMKPRVRGETVYGEPGTAGYLATLQLEEPTVVEITAEGPLKAPQATQRTSKTLLVMPGQDVLGEGVLLEIHGFIVTLTKPGTEYVPKQGEELEVRATVTMT